MKQQAAPVTRKLRSSLRRRRRPDISPIILSGKATNASSSSFSLLSREREASCVSTRASVAADNSPARIVTRLYSKKREREEREREVSESSCVESNLTVSTAEFPRKTAKLAPPEEEVERESSKTGKLEREGSKTAKLERESSKTGKLERESSKTARLDREGSKTAKLEREILVPAAGATNSEFSCVESCSDLTIDKNEISSADFPAKIDSPTRTEEREGENRTENKLICSDLVCSELLRCDEDQSDYSSAFSDLESDVFGKSSSDYTPSIWLDSGSEFSERSIEESNPSPTFSLFIQFSHQFCYSAFSRGSKIVSEIENEYRGVPMEDEEDELSYKMLRSRERKEVYMQDYAEEYCSDTDYGHLVIQQRLEMVHWIVEQTTSKELHKETLFLAVNLLDRFLSKGFFKSKRNLQVAAISCLTLATRIEENQPFNTVRKRIICVGNDTYSRCEVVAMEWLVQEVLNFRCFMPTIYNFLWFYLKAAKANEDVEKTAKYLAVLALLGHEQLCFWPSTVAAGLVILASLSAKQDALCNRVVETHVRTKEDDLSGCLKSLEWLVKYAC